MVEDARIRAEVSLGDRFRRWGVFSLPGERLRAGRMWHWVYGRAGTDRRRSGDVSPTDFITWPRAEERFLNTRPPRFRWGQE
ncbi:MAG: hypothetical protein ACREV3_09785, partial [Gammaproteobacteria bacterium]